MFIERINEAHQNTSARNDIGHSLTPLRAKSRRKGTEEAR
jgi:hypothetical protein